jgi:cell division protein FtsI (penicillin-binding protein 3)
MSENVKYTILRFAAVFGIILVLFIVVFVRIISLQTVHRNQLESMVAHRDSVYRTDKAIRGNIYDSKGRLLASSVPQYSIHMDTRVEALHLNNGKVFYEYVDSIAEGLSNIIGDQTKEQYRNKMIRAYKGKTIKERDIRLTNKRISYTQLKEIKKLPLVCKGVYKSGFYFVDLNQRVKPFNSLASRTIGSIYAESGKGNAGLELRFDEYLQGKDGRSIRQRVANEWEYVPIVHQENGCDIYTTLDANLLDICESNLREQLDSTEGEWGCVILMEVETGEIKAMCNLDRGSDGKYYERSNHAVTRLEPGSTFKTVALMAAMDDGKIGINDTIRVWRNGWKYSTKLHKDAHAADTTYTTREALTTSSNIALARIITRSYNGSAKQFVDKLKSMHLCDSIDYIIPGAQQAVINVPKDKVSISLMSYGYSLELNPLQVVTFYNAIANNGKMISPILVKEIRKGTETIETFETQVINRKICNDRTLENIQACLHDVVWAKGGTAHPAQSGMVSIAGKTGTAQLNENGKYTNQRHRISFVGYFPEEKPQYTCICVINKPRRDKNGSGAQCGTVVRKIAEEAMVYSSEYIIQGKQLVLCHKK